MNLNLCNTTVKMSNITIFNLVFIEKNNTYYYSVGGFDLFEYSGETSDGVAHGHGKLINRLYSMIYEGNWLHGKLSTGTKYYIIGDYIAKLMGDKIPRDKKVIVYIGEFENQSLTDELIIKQVEDLGTDLSKNLKNSKFNSTIRLISKTVGLIESGIGILYNSGNKYDGLFINGLFTSGTIYYNNGDIAEGTFENNIVTSNVIYYSPSLHGKGKMIKRNEIYQGEFYKGILVNGSIKKEDEERSVDYRAIINNDIIEACIEQTKQLLRS